MEITSPQIPSNSKHFPNCTNVVRFMNIHHGGWLFLNSKQAESLNVLSLTQSGQVDRTFNECVMHWGREEDAYGWWNEWQLTRWWCQWDANEMLMLIVMTLCKFELQFLNYFYTLNHILFLTHSSSSFFCFFFLCKCVCLCCNIFFPLCMHLSRLPALMAIWLSGSLSEVILMWLLIFYLLCFLLLSNKMCCCVVVGKPELTTRPHDVDVSFGGTAYFNCRADGDPRPEIIWYRNR